MEHHQQESGDHDHQGHHRKMIRDFKNRFWVSLALTLPVLILSPLIQKWLSLDIDFKGDIYLLFGLSTIIYFYGGFPFLKGLWDEVSKGAAGMMTLIGVAISAAYLYSLAVVFGLEGKTFFWELATLIDVMLLGHWLEMRSILGASRALHALADLIPDTAHLVQDDEIKEVPVDQLKPSDHILIKPGEKVPVDGIIVEGSSSLNESLLTGESKPISKTKNDEVIGGAVNGNGAITVRVKDKGEDTYISRVIRMVEEAQGQKSKTQRLADKAAFWLTLLALGAGFTTFFIWLAKGSELSFALERMVTVMVICCPHALGLAIPLVAAISTSISAKNGLLIRNRTAFENSRKITALIFDKTGTLTKGSHEVVDVSTFSNDYSPEDIIKYAASLESPSEHHIAKGIQNKAKKENIAIWPVKEFEYQAGVGVSGSVKGYRVSAGGHGLLQSLEIEVPEDSDKGFETKIFLIVEGKTVGSISFADEIRASSQKAVQALQQNGIKVSLLTGDSQEAAAAVAKELGMDNFSAEVLPDQKLEEVKKLQEKGEFVAMTGDGVNDAPALARADVGIAIGSGTDVAAETADIVLTDSDPEDIANLVLFGKATYNKMIQNLAWAAGYNVITIPLATGFIPGLMISPAFGAALMSLSTIICAANAQLLRRKLN